MVKWLKVYAHIEDAEGSALVNACLDGQLDRLLLKAGARSDGKHKGRTALINY
jgi:hypothetical protein